MNNIKDIKVRCTYSYQKYPRKIITTSIREDLRDKLKSLSFEEHEYETKIFDMLLDELFTDKQLRQKVLKKVRNYY